MVPLPLANILHHKLRSALSASGVAIGVCMLITLSGLTRGSLKEVSDRWTAVDADLIVYPARRGDNITTISGGGLTDADAAAVAKLALGPDPAVERVVPVFLYRISIAGQEHNVVGVDSRDLTYLLGGGQVKPGGSVFDPQGEFAQWLQATLAQQTDQLVDISEAELASRGGLEMVIDDRLAKAADLDVGSEVYAAGHHFSVVGVVPAGAMVRAFIPRATAEFLFNGPLGRFTLMFVKLRPQLRDRPGPAIAAIGKSGRLTAVPVRRYQDMLQERFGVMFVYVDAVNAVTLVVAFLFILVTLYTMVIQRTREIAILKSMGATRWLIVRTVLAESLLLSAAGALLGAVAAPAVGVAIEYVRPLLTVHIGWQWVAIAAAAAAVGGTAAAVYPALCAIRVDVAEALTLE